MSLHCKCFIGETKLWRCVAWDACLSLLWPSLLYIPNRSQVLSGATVYGYCMHPTIYRPFLVGSFVGVHCIFLFTADWVIVEQQHHMLIIWQNWFKEWSPVGFFLHILWVIYVDCGFPVLALRVVISRVAVVVLCFEFLDTVGTTKRWNTLARCRWVSCNSSSWNCFTSLFISLHIFNLMAMSGTFTVTSNLKIQSGHFKESFQQKWYCHGSFIIKSH